MPREPNGTDLKTAIQDAANEFVAQILLLVRHATVNELAALTSVSEGLAAREQAAPPEVAPKRRGRPPKAAAEAPARKPGRPPKADKAAAPVKKARKKRIWPKCSARGCDKNVYMPSGPAKMCYQHYMKQGGKPSPLVAYRKKQADAEGGEKKPAARKTVLRKAARKK